LFDAAHCVTAAAGLKPNRNANVSSRMQGPVKNSMARMVSAGGLTKSGRNTIAAPLSALTHVFETLTIRRPVSM
jgi:hypothetical protein